MYPELTNLLPPERLGAVRREYFLRLASVVLYLLAGVIVLSGALLVPTYLYLSDQIAQRSARVAQLDASLAAEQGTQTNARLSALTSTTGYLARLASTSSETAALQNVLSAPHAGIVLTSFSVTPARQGAQGKMTLVGVASTRETLRAYNDALVALPGVANVDLPISAYAKDSAIPFTVTLTGTLTP